MALPSFLQSMFTPQRSGPGQMAWRDKDVGMGSGEIEQGDIQEMYWKRGAAAPGRGQQMTSAVRPNPTGSGETLETKISDLIPTGLEPGGITSITETELEPGGMSSISEIMQSSTPAGMAGEMSPMGYQPFDPMGSGADRMLGNSRFGGGTQPSYSMRDTSAEEGPGMFSQGPTTVGDPNFYEDATPMVPTATDSVRPGESMSGGWMDEQIPIQGTRFAPASERMPVLRFLQSLLGGGGSAPASTPFIPPDTLTSTGGQFKNIYEGQTGGDDVMNAFQAYLRQRQ